MAFVPISGIVPQATENGNQANGMVLKFYETGTLTPLAVGVDSTGVTQTTEFVLDIEGYTTLSTVRVIPHVDQIYKEVLYLNQADADANDTGSAVYVIDDLNVGDFGSPAATSFADYDNLLSAVNSVIGDAGDFITTGEYNSGTGVGGSRYQIVDIDPGFPLINPQKTNGDWLKLIANGELSSSQAGASSSKTPVENSAALTQALNSGISSNVTVSKGEYAEIVISQSDKNITIERGAIFKLPNNTTTIATTIPVPVIEVTGSNINFYNHLYIDGNLANNPSDGMDASKRIGALHLAGDTIEFSDEITIENASWVGCSAGSEDDSSTNVNMQTLNVINPFSYGTSFWQSDNTFVDRIRIFSGIDSTDARVRTGTQTTSSFECKRLTINSITTNQAVIVEAKTTDSHIGSVQCVTMKVEDANTVTIGSVISVGEVGTSFGFAILSSANIDVGAVIVEDYAGSTGKAVSFSGITNCSVDTVHVRGTVVNDTDVEIRGADGLTINSIFCVDPVGTGKGFVFDFDVLFAPQINIRIGKIISSGHTDLDVEVQSPDLADILVENISDLATTNLEYLKNGGKYSEGVFIPTLTPTTSGTLTISGANNSLAYTENGRAITITGRLKLSAVSSPLGNMTLAALPFTCAQLDDVAGMSLFTIILQDTTGAWAGTIVGQVSEGTDTILIFGRDGPSAFDTADLMAVDTTIGFSFTYFRE